jgi:hypothetical protein
MLTHRDVKLSHYFISCEALVAGDW